MKRPTKLTYLLFFMLLLSGVFLPIGLMVAVVCTITDQLTAPQLLFKGVLLFGLAYILKEVLTVIATTPPWTQTQKPNPTNERTN